MPASMIAQMFAGHAGQRFGRTTVGNHSPASILRGRISIAFDRNSVTPRRRAKAGCAGLYGHRVKRCA
jgi:hypothetical protein